MAKLIINTPFGTFDRTTKSDYKWAVVRTSPRAMASFEDAKKGYKHRCATDIRWVKDRGYAVTWHKSQDACAAAASKPYLWDRATEVVGIFAVEAK